MTFPTPEDSVLSQGSGTSATMTMPSSIAENDQLTLIIGVRAYFSNTTLSGWVYKGSSGGSVTDMAVFVRKAGTSEASTVVVGLSGNAHWSGIIYRTSGAADQDTTPPEVAFDFEDANNATKTPVILTPTGGAKDYMWITAFFHRDSGTVSTFPTSYVGTKEVVTGSARLSGYAHRLLNASSETPGTFVTSKSADWSAVTIAIHPSGGGPAQSIVPLVVQHLHNQGIQ